jgi:predicted esterase
VEAWAPPEPAYCLIAYHGYAEAALAPLAALRRAGLDDGVLLAPLAPHHFYNRRGEVVGSWMTSFERDQRVEELLDHGRALWQEVLRLWGELPLFLFGFSQGGANAYRIALLAGLPVRRCFVLGADQPPEVSQLQAAVGGPALTLMTGREDAASLAQTMENDHRSLAERRYNVERLSIQGGHEYSPEALELLHRRIRDDL